MRHLRLMSSTLLMTMAMTGCYEQKSDGVSDPKTLDNVAANTVLRGGNSCRGEEDAMLADGAFNTKYASRILLPDPAIVVADDAKAQEKALKDAVKVALTAVPDYSQRLFDRLKGNILVTNAVADLCGAVTRDPLHPQATNQAAIDKIESCTLLTAPRNATGNSRVLSLVIKADTKAIGHNLVRAFGYLHAQFYIRLQRNTGAGGPLFDVVDRDGEGVANFKDQLTRSFLRDMLPGGKDRDVFNVKSLDYMLGVPDTDDQSVTLASRIKANLDANGDANSVFAGLTMGLARGTGATDPQRLARMARFRDTILANAYDSLYCRPNGAYPESAKGATTPEGLAVVTDTDGLFRDYFNATYTAFNNTVLPALAQQAEQISRMIAENDTSTAPAEVGFESKPSAGFGLTQMDWLSSLSMVLMGAVSGQSRGLGMPVAGFAGASALGSYMNAAMRAPASPMGGQNQGLAAAGGQCRPGCPCNCGGGNCDCLTCGCCGGGQCQCNGACGGCNLMNA